MPHVCPWWHAYTFDNCIRRIFYKAESASLWRRGVVAIILSHFPCLW